jgi:hypothetical protein
VPVGINVESLSIYKEEIDAAHELFQKLQVADTIKKKHFLKEIEPSHTFFLGYLTQ